MELFLIIQSSRFVCHYAKQLTRDGEKTEFEY